MKIQFKNREVEVTEVCPGVCKKSETVYYCLCSVTNKWFYASKKRLDRLIEKKGSVEKVGTDYDSREGKPQKAKPEPEKVEAAPKAPKGKKAKVAVDAPAIVVDNVPAVETPVVA